MKYTVKELKHKTNINETLDLNHLIKEDSDLISLSDVKVEGTINKNENAVIFDIVISTKATQKSALSLRPVVYDLSFSAEIIFSDELKEYDYTLLDEIELDDIIYAYIETERPYRVLSDDDDQTEFN